MLSVHHFDFLNLNFSTAHTVDRPIVRHCAKYHGNQSNCCRDLVTYESFQDGGCPLSWLCRTHFGFTHEEYFSALVYHCAKFVLNPKSSFNNWKFEYIMHLAWKRLSMPPKWWFGIWHPKGVVSARPQKAHSSAETHCMTYRSSKSIHQSGSGMIPSIKKMVS